MPNLSRRVAQALATAAATTWLLPVAPARAEAPPCNSHYCWTLSASSTDPLQNYAQPVAMDTVNVYLWLYCVREVGAAAAEFSLGSTFPFPAGAFTPLNGAVYTGFPGTLDVVLSMPCVMGTTLLGAQPFFDAGFGGSVCLSPSIGWGRNVTVDCREVGAQEWSHGVRGFSSTGAPPCEIDECPVEPASWGALKSLYR